MGLQLTLPKTSNYLYHDFVDAYWCIRHITYSTELLAGELQCYPSRESAHSVGRELDLSYINVGGPSFLTSNPMLYSWNFQFRISDVFPTGIPLNANEQKRGIYEKIKSYLDAPFVDVFEE